MKQLGRPQFCLPGVLTRREQTDAEGRPCETLGDGIYETEKEASQKASPAEALVPFGVCPEYTGITGWSGVCVPSGLFLALPWHCAHGLNPAGYFLGFLVPWLPTGFNPWEGAAGNLEGGGLKSPCSSSLLWAALSLWDPASGPP